MEHSPKHSANTSWISNHKLLFFTIAIFTSIVTILAIIQVTPTTSTSSKLSNINRAFNFVYNMSMVASNYTSQITADSKLNVTKDTIGRLFTNTYKGKTDRQLKRFTIYHDLRGRLGNVMSQTASLYGITRFTNRSLVLAAPQNYLRNVKHIFPKLPVPIIQPNDFIQRTKNLKYVSENDLKDLYTDLLALPKEDIRLCCYFQKYKYFVKFEKEVRDVLQFNAGIQSGAAQNIKSVLAEKKIANRANATVVCLHVRRGDFVTERHYQLPGPSFYKNATDYLKSRYANTVFIAFSDDRKWSQTNLGPFGVQLSHGKSPMEDMATFSLCDHAVISLGSFSWWAGYLTKGEVIYYVNSKSVPKGAKIWQIRNSEHIPSHWTPMTDL